MDDIDTGTRIFSASGAPNEISAEYQSFGNDVVVSFTSDSNTNLAGWRLEWTRVDPATTTQATTPAGENL